MARPILPGRWGAKPPAGTPVAWGHPLARGLVTCLPLSEGAGAPFDYALQALGAKVGSGQIWAPGRAGPALWITVSTSYGTFNPGNSPRGKPPIPNTMVALVNITDLSANRAVIQNDSSSTTASHGMTLGVSNVGRIYYAANDGTNELPSGYKRAESATGAVVVNAWHLIVAVMRSPTDASIYVNGVSSAVSYAGTSAGTLPFYGTGVGRVGSDSNFGSFLSGRIELFYQYDRALTQDEALLLTADPYALFVPPRRWWMGVAGTIHALAGTSTGTGSQSGTLIVAKPLAGSNVGTGTQIGALLEADHLSGSSLGTGTATGALVSTKPIAGGSVGTGSQGGSLTESDTVAGSTLGTGTASGTVKRAVSLSGTSTGTGTASASFAGAQALAGTTTGTGTQTGSLVEADTVAGATTGAGSQTGTLRLVRGVAGIATGTGSLSGTPRRTITLSGEIVGAGDTWGYLFAAKPLSGVSVGMGSGSGDLSIFVPLLPLATFLAGRSPSTYLSGRAPVAYASGRTPTIFDGSDTR